MNDVDQELVNLLILSICAFCALVMGVLWLNKRMEDDE